MPNERTIPTPADPSVVTFSILSDGQRLPGTVEVLSIVVHHAVNRIPQATLLIRDGDAASQTFAASESDDFAPGRELSITAGYRATEDTIFKGIVVAQSLKVRGQRSVLRVVCKAKAYTMALLPRSTYFRDVTDSDVMETIIQRNGLSAQVTATTASFGEMVQYQSTDWDFLMTRAEANGMVCIVDNDQISMAPPALQAPSVLQLAFGATLHELDLEMDARTQFKAIQSNSWDVAGQAVLESEEEDISIPQAGNLDADDLADVHGQTTWTQRHSGHLQEEELKNWAQGRLLKSRLAKIRGRAQFQGFAGLLPGQVVKLEGVGERFEGELYVSAVRHQIADGDWVTDAEFGLSPQWFSEQYDVPQPPASALLPPVSGLQIGQVTQLQDDPAGEFRIMVRLPLIDPQDSGSWARIATLDAGDGRGSFFRPEIGDEVVVGFLNDDPRHPVVLGALNSSAKPAPLPHSDDNHDKGWVTRSGTKCLFNDEHKDVLIETTDGNLLKISGQDQSITLQDQHGNKLVMDSNGITLESIKDIQVKATAALTAEGATFELKGQSTGKVSASGQLTVQGGLVQIN